MKRTLRYIVLFFIAAVIVLAVGVEPLSVPVTGRKTTVIVVDAGHGGFDGGAVGRLTNVKEAELNLIIAKKLEVFLKNQGYTVIMTREDENALANTKDADMQKRRDIINSSGADLAVSIHMNKFADTSCAGPVVFYHEESEEGEKLAAAIQEKLVEAAEPERPRTHRPETYYILRAGSCPSVIVECGFLSNEREEKLLQTEAYQNLIAQAIFKGITQYLAQREGTLT